MPHVPFEKAQKIERAFILHNQLSWLILKQEETG
jgi:hypothetical protein